MLSCRKRSDSAAAAILMSRKQDHLVQLSAHDEHLFICCYMYHSPAVIEAVLEGGGHSNL